MIHTSRIERYFIYLTIFVTGAAIMVVELLGARIIGPYYGVSLYVWSSLITVTLIALSLGYWLGGMAADRRPKADSLYLFIFLAGLSILIIPSISSPILKTTDILGIRAGALTSSFILFTIPLFFLGMVTPYVVKLLTKELSVLGTTAGNLYAISTIGGVAGTILTGFILIPNLGVRKIIYLQSIILILLWGGWHLLRKRYFKSLLILPFILILVVNLLEKPRLYSGEKGRVIYRGESIYGQTKVVDIGDQRWLLIEGSAQTAIYRKKGESILPYIYFMELLPYINPKADNVLTIGLGGGSISRAFQKYGLKVESIEISPEVVDIARKYFGFKGEVITSDARTYIRRTKKKYDFIISDAYASDAVPAHLTTREAFEETKEILKSEGIFAINYVGFLKGKESIAYKSVHKTLRQVFSYTQVYSTKKGNEIGCIIIFASNKEINPVKGEKKYRNRAVKYWHSRMKKMRINDGFKEGIILTDDYNPIEILTVKSSEEQRKSAFKTFGKELLSN